MLYGVAQQFVDGDDLHPEANRAKMAAGHALTDEDRAPWLERVGEVLAASPGAGPVVACSALKKAYRSALRAAAPDTVFVHLTGGAGLIKARMVHREHHFMPAALLDTQIETLEPLTPDETGVVLDTSEPIADVVARAVAFVQASV